jgi:hypothetical protein
MAVYFREITGIDPVTVDQTRLSERSAPEWEHPAYRAAVSAGLVDDGPVVVLAPDGEPWSPASFDVDLQVFTPRTGYTHGRPQWMALGGHRQALEVDATPGNAEWTFVEARVVGEPPEAIPLDRCEAKEPGTVVLFLPPEEDAVIRVFGADGSVLQTIGGAEAGTE